jgi:hypothetical protein
MFVHLKACVDCTNIQLSLYEICLFHHAFVYLFLSNEPVVLLRSKAAERGDQPGQTPTLCN